MEVLFHFVFELFKIAILASIYASLIVVAIVLIGRRKPDSWFGKITENKSRLWFRTGFIISLILFAYMFTYWGDHGLGDSSKIPIGHGKSVEQINGTTTYIRADGYEFETLQIDEFATTKNFLFARKGEGNNEEKSSEYVVWNLKTNKADFLDAYSSLDSFARVRGISEPIRFSDFLTHYKKHWNGWRFWLLP
jgi:hypothetical protein